MHAVIEDYIEDQIAAHDFAITQVVSQSGKQYHAGALTELRALKGWIILREAAAACKPAISKEGA